MYIDRHVTTNILCLFVFIWFNVDGDGCCWLLEIIIIPVQMYMYIWQHSFVALVSIVELERNKLGALFVYCIKDYSNHLIWWLYHCDVYLLNASWISDMIDSFFRFSCLYPHVCILVFIFSCLCQWQLVYVVFRWLYYSRELISHFTNHWFIYSIILSFINQH